MLWSWTVLYVPIDVRVEHHKSVKRSFESFTENEKRSGDRPKPAVLSGYSLAVQLDMISKNEVEFRRQQMIPSSTRAIGVHFESKFQNNEVTHRFMIDFK